MRRLVGKCLVVVLSALCAANAWAADGDFMVRRNDAETDTVTTSNFDSTWDTLVDSSGSAITYSAGTFTLVDTGHYLVIYNEQLVNAIGSARNEVQGRLVIGGTEEQVGGSQCFIRKLNDDYDCFLSGGGIINTTSASTSLVVRMYRTDTGDGTVTRVADKGGVTIVKLDDTWDYARYELGSTLAMSDTTAGFHDVSWGTNVEQDTGFSRTGADITITNAGRYLVSFTVPVNNPSGWRSHPYFRITLDGVEQAGGHASSYIRGSDGCNDGVTSYMGIINVAASDVLTLEYEFVGYGGSAGDNDAHADSTIQILELPSGNETIIIEATTGDMNPTTATEFTFDTNPHIDTAAFTHTASSSVFQTDLTDDYLIFHNFKYNDEGLERAVADTYITVNNVEQTWGRGARYSRGYSYDGGEASQWGGGLFAATATDDISCENIATANTGTGDVAYAAFTALRLGSIFSAPTPTPTPTATPTHTPTPTPTPTNTPVPGGDYLHELIHQEEMH